MPCHPTWFDARIDFVLSNECWSREQTKTPAVGQQALCLRIIVRTFFWQDSISLWMFPISCTCDCPLIRLTVRRWSERPTKNICLGAHLISRQTTSRHSLMHVRTCCVDRGTVKIKMMSVSPIDPMYFSSSCNSKHCFSVGIEPEEGTLSNSRLRSKKKFFVAKLPIFSRPFSVSSNKYELRTSATQFFQKMKYR